VSSFCRLDDGALLDQRPDDFLDEIGIAIRLAHDEFTRLARHVLDAQMRRDESIGIRVRQRLQCDFQIAMRKIGLRLHLDLPGGRLPLRTKGAEEQDGHVVDQREQMHDQFDRYRIGPLQIVDHDDRRAGLAAFAEGRLHQL